MSKQQARNLRLGLDNRTACVFSKSNMYSTNNVCETNDVVHIEALILGLI